MRSQPRGVAPWLLFVHSSAEAGSLRTAVREYAAMTTGSVARTGSEPVTFALKRSSARETLIPLLLDRGLHVGTETIAHIRLRQVVGDLVHQAEQIVLRQVDQKAVEL